MPIFHRSKFHKKLFDISVEIVLQNALGATRLGMMARTEHNNGQVTEQCAALAQAVRRANS